VISFVFCPISPPFASFSSCGVKIRSFFYKKVPILPFFPLSGSPFQKYGFTCPPFVWGPQLLDSSAISRFFGDHFLTLLRPNTNDLEAPISRTFPFFLLLFPSRSIAEHSPSARFLRNCSASHPPLFFSATILSPDRIDNLSFRPVGWNVVPSVFEPLASRNGNCLFSQIRYFSLFSSNSFSNRFFLPSIELLSVSEIVPQLPQRVRENVLHSDSSLPYFLLPL